MDQGVPLMGILTTSAVGTAELIKRGEASSLEIVQLALARIDEVNPAVNAVVEVRHEEAMQEAEDADRRAGDQGLGPFHGVPMTVKEAFNVAGLQTTWGNPIFQQYVADTDATVVQRLRQAGAIVIGKSNVPLMLGDFGQSFNDIYGATNNPWDLLRTPGGSSGGGAAAVAAGMSFLEYGSDLVGSIRIPASFCGVYGLKPSVGIVPGTGFQPPGPPASPSDMAYMSAFGPLGRSARDLRAALSATAGPESPANLAYSWRLAPPRHTALAEYRVGAVLDHGLAPVSSEVGGPLSDAIDALARSGVKIVEGWPEGVEPAEDYQSFGFHVGLFLASQQPGQPSPTMAEFSRHEARRMQTRVAWGRFFDDTDVFLCPTNFTAAFPHDERPFEERLIETPEGMRPYSNQPFWISHASLAGIPAVAAPIGSTAHGLPVGGQIIGPLYEDDTALTFAELLAEVVGGFEPPPLTVGSDPSATVSQ